MSLSKQEAGVWGTLKPFVYGGLSGMFATTCIQPIDMVKVRIQLLGEGGTKIETKNPFRLAAQVMKNEGVFSLYKGLSAALLRQATYTTARLGLFTTISHAMKGRDNQPLSYWKKVVASLTAGGLGSVVGTPADVALIRMQADGTLPPDQRRGYKNVIDAFIKIVKQEGFFGMFRGTTPVVVRAMALNVGMLATYDQTRDMLKPYSNNQMFIDGAAKVLSGFFASAFSLPFDFLKTRIQKMKPGPDGKMPYNGLVDCAIKVTKQEGITTFYRGFWTYYVRIAPHAMITLYALEKLQKWFG